MVPARPPRALARGWPTYAETRGPLSSNPPDAAGTTLVGAAKRARRRVLEGVKVLAPTRGGRYAEASRAEAVRPATFARQVAGEARRQAESQDRERTGPGDRASSPGRAHGRLRRSSPLRRRYAVAEAPAEPGRSKRHRYSLLTGAGASATGPNRLGEGRPGRSDCQAPPLPMPSSQPLSSNPPEGSKGATKRSRRVLPCASFRDDLLHHGVRFPAMTKP